MEKVTQQSKDAMLKLIAYVIINIPVWIIRFGGLYLRFKTMARTAGKEFYHELCVQGVAEPAASKLTEVYMNSSHLSRMFRKK